jgi:hypothetical protein
MIAVYLLMIARAYSKVYLLKPLFRIAALGLLFVVLLEQTWIGIGPILGYPGLASQHHHWFYLHHSPNAMTETLKKLGRRPIGFCKSPGNN